MNIKSQALSYHLGHKTLSLTAAGMLAVTACAWGIAQGCKALAERSADRSTNTSLSHQSGSERTAS